MSYKHKAIPGTPLAEVFSVIINHDVEECKLCGTIMVRDDEGTLIIYNVGPEDAETICSGQSLLLSNRERAMLSSSHYSVHFDLKMKGDPEFIVGSFSWDATTDGCYNKFLAKKVKGKLGSATVYYTVHSVAIEANIGVQYIEGETVKSDIYGRLVARYKNTDDNDASQDLKDHSQVTIFEGNLDNLEKGDIFVLDKSVVSWPPYTSLVIRIYLQYVEDGEALLDDEVEFLARNITYRVAHQDIKVTFGVIRVVSVCAVDYAQSFSVVQEVKNWLREIGYFPEC